MIPARNACCIQSYFKSASHIAPAPFLAPSSITFHHFPFLIITINRYCANRKYYDLQYPKNACRSSRPIQDPLQRQGKVSPSRFHRVTRKLSLLGLIPSSSPPKTTEEKGPEERKANERRHKRKRCKRKEGTKKGEDLRFSLVLERINGYMRAISLCMRLNQVHHSHLRWSFAP
jgi:hypothetical protein